LAVPASDSALLTADLQNQVVAEFAAAEWLN
jgi:hypothetical protein